MAPNSTMMIEMTQARTGRSMKKRASMPELLSGDLGRRGVRGQRHRHPHQPGLAGDSRRDLLQAVDDPLLARLQAGSDLPQAVVQRSQPDRARDYFTVAVHHVDNLLP